MNSECEGDSGTGDRAGPDGLGGEAGFASVSGISFFFWLGTYLLLGLLVGKGLGHPLPFAGLGVLVGLYPSAIMSVRAHYGGFLSLLPLGYLIAFRYLSPDVQMVVGCLLCLVPGFLAVPLSFQWISSRSKQTRLRTALRGAAPEELIGYLTSGSGPELCPAIQECGRRGDPLSVPALGLILRKHPGELDGVRKEAARALLSIGSPEAKEILRAVVEEEENKNVRNGAVIEVIRTGLDPASGTDP